MSAKRWRWSSAETETAARDAAELVAVDYDPRDAVVDVRRAAEPGAPQLWAQAPGNLALDWHGPGADAADARTRSTQVFTMPRMSPASP